MVAVLFLLFTSALQCAAFSTFDARKIRLFTQYAVANDFEDLEASRKLFESTLNQLGATSDTDKYLTQAACKRRDIEIKLLLELQHGDEAVDELTGLWLYEHPSPLESETKEDAIRSICMQHPTWSEPSARLAVALFFQGRYKEAQEQVDQVLNLKPWHFEMVQLQVLLCLTRLEKSKAVHWARKGLPPMTQPAKRAKWIRAAVTDANDQLIKMQQRPSNAMISSSAWH